MKTTEVRENKVNELNHRNKKKNSLRKNMQRLNI